MHTVFGYVRYLVMIAVLGLMVCAVGVFVYAAVTTVTTIVEPFREGVYNTHGARLLSIGVIELIDLYLLGTVLLIVSVGLYQLFIDPQLVLPEWLSVTNLEQLKGNLVAVIVVMLAILFLGGAAGELGGMGGLMEAGIGIALVIAALAAAVFIFQRVLLTEEAAKRAATLEKQRLDDERPKA